MKQKKIIKIATIIIIVLIIILLGLIINKVIREKQKNIKNIEIINNNNKLLEDKITEYNKIRTDIKDIISNTYTEKLNEKYNDITELLKKEENIIKELEQPINKLKISCKKNQNNKKCNNYKVYYEKIVNIYINDINDINKLIDVYNEDNNKLERITTTYKYIDYNKDGNYIERE